MTRIKLKWNKNTYEDFVVDPALGVVDLKRKIHSLTGVPTDRQKLMCKGGWIGTLKDDADLSKMPISDGLSILLMGSAESLTEAPKIKFVEDMTEQEKVEIGAVVSAGFQNLGNTCYLNSVVQSLRHMPELRHLLDRVTPPTAAPDGNSALALAVRETLNQVDASASAIPPFGLVANLRRVHPQFAERGQGGQFSQQDAEELLSLLFQTLSNSTTNSTSGNDNFSSVLGLQLEEKLSCQESSEEPVVVKAENAFKLICNIQGSVSGGSSAVDHLADGLKIALEGTTEKFSAVLNRDAIWQKKQRIATLPKYLCIHFMRFFWKPTPESRDHAGVKCKILRAVSFPDVFDIYDFCTEALQEKLKKNRAADDKRVNTKLAVSTLSQSVMATETAREKEAAVGVADVTASTGEANVAMEEDVEDEDEKALREALILSTSAPAEDHSPSASEYADIGNGLPPNFGGLYELRSVVTHKGRSADSGHYIGWARQAPSSALWWKYDDEKVTEARTEEILQLCGGGDRDMVYLLFYRYKETQPV